MQTASPSGNAGRFDDVKLPHGVFSPGEIVPMRTNMRRSWADANRFVMLAPRLRAILLPTSSRPHLHFSSVSHVPIHSRVDFIGRGNCRSLDDGLRRTLRRRRRRIGDRARRRERKNGVETHVAWLGKEIAVAAEYGACAKQGGGDSSGERRGAHLTAQPVRPDSMPGRSTHEPRSAANYESNSMSQYAWLTNFDQLSIRA